MLNFDLAKGARKIVEVCANIKAGDKVLIITDTATSPNISEALAVAVKAIDAEVNVLITSPGKKPGEEPNSVVASAMLAADVILSPTIRTLYHTIATKKALEKGARLIALTGVTDEVLISGGIDADFLALQPMIKSTIEMFDKGNKVHVTTEAGTDLRLDISGRPVYNCNGFCHNPGERIGVPDLEAFTAPIEDKTNGTLVVDASIAGLA